MILQTKHSITFPGWSGCVQQHILIMWISMKTQLEVCGAPEKCKLTLCKNKIQHKNIMVLPHCNICLQFKVRPLGVPLIQSVLSHRHMKAERLSHCVRTDGCDIQTSLYQTGRRMGVCPVMAGWETLPLLFSRCVQPADI